MIDGNGSVSLNNNNLSLNEVDERNVNFVCGDVGTVLTNHHIHVGPLGQFSGAGSMAGGGIHAFCIIIV